MSDNLYRNINGQLQRHSGYTSADPVLRSRFGLYETILYRNGAPEHAGLHWERLLRGLVQLGFEVPAHYHPDYFTAAVQELVQANGLEQLARIRLQVLQDDEQQPFFYLESFPLDPALLRYNTAGLTAGILEPYQKPLITESNLKLSHNSYAVPAAAAMQQYGWDEVLLCNELGHICETAIANIFLVADGEIITPPLSEGCLAGVMRSWWMPRLQEAGYPVREKPVTEQMLLQADELLLTNSVRPLRWIGQIGERHFGNRLGKELWQQLIP